MDNANHYNIELTKENDDGKSGYELAKFHGVTKVVNLIRRKSVPFFH